MLFYALKNCLKNILPESWYKSLRTLYHKLKGNKFDAQKFFSDMCKERIGRPVDNGKKISILCNIWNTPIEFLKQMMDSVVSQNYQNWELLLNNCSDDKHPEVGELIEKYATDVRVKIFRTENKGIANNSNFVLSQATGEFVFLMDHDDFLLPDTLEELAAAQEKENSDFIYADEFVLFMSIMCFTEVRKKPFAMTALEKDNYINHPGLIRKELLEKAGSFRDGFEGSQDHDLYLRVCEKTEKISYVPKLLYVWRINEGSFSERRLDVCIDSGRRAVQEHLDRMGIPGKVVAEAASPRYSIVYDKK